MPTPDTLQKLLDQIDADESHNSRRLADLVWPDVCQTPNDGLRFRALEAALKVYGIEVHPTVQ
jgi:hypothetical protein